MVSAVSKMNFELIVLKVITVEYLMKNERMKLVGTGEFPPEEREFPESSGQPLQGQLV